MHNLCCAKCLSESIAAKHCVSWLSLDVQRTWRRPIKTALEFVILCCNRWLKIEVTALGGLYVLRCVSLFGAIFLRLPFFAVSIAGDVTERKRNPWRDWLPLHHWLWNICNFLCNLRWSHPPASKHAYELVVEVEIDQNWPVRANIHISQSQLALC